MRDIHKNYILIVLVASLLLNVWLGFLAPHKRDKYPYLSPRIFVSNPNDIIINFQKLREELRAYPAANNIPLGIYFEYLPSGTSIGVNEKEVFFSASLIKIPVVMRTFRHVNEGKLALDQQVVIEEKHLDKTFGTIWMKGVGNKVAIEELIRHVLTESDSTAYNMLGDITKSHEVNGGRTELTADVYEYLDLPNDTVGNQYGITPKNFSSILRSLYLSAYLPYEDSSHILTLMTQSTFDKWLPEPLPRDIKVAHKYGVYAGTSQAHQVQSDCGIVYVPLRPYMLCVMVRTNDKTVAEKHIREISRKTFEFVNLANPVR